MIKGISYLSFENGLEGGHLLIQPSNKPNLMASMHLNWQYRPKVYSLPQPLKMSVKKFANKLMILAFLSIV